MPEMEKFGTYAVTLSYTKTVNNPVDTTIKHTFRTTLNGESIADNTKADDEVFAVTYGQTADMTTHSKAGQTGYEGYTVEAYDPASKQLAAGATGTIQYLREYVTVVFDMNGGTWNDSLNNVEYTVVKGDALATDQPVPAPTPDGYNYVGWEGDVEGATVDGTFTQKTTFTAKWSKVPAVDYTVTHVYLTNGAEDGRTTETFTGTEGETIAAADIKRVTEYAGNTYEFESATADIVLKSGEAKNITLTYTRTYTEPTPPPYYPPVDPTPTPTPDPTEIPEDDVPLSDTPTEIPEDDVPLGDQPGIPGFDNTPKTGDNAHYRFWVIVSLLSGLGLIVLGFDGRKRSRRTGR